MKPEDYFVPSLPEPVIRGAGGRIVAKIKQQESHELESNYECRNYGFGRVRDRKISEPTQHEGYGDPSHPGSQKAHAV